MKNPLLLKIQPFFWFSYKKDLSVVRMEEGCNKSPMIHGFIFYQIEKSNKQR